MDKKGTHNVKIYAENQTKTILLHTRAWATAQKTPSLTTAARAVAKHAAHGQRRQYHANAEVICHLQLGFQLVESVWNNFRQVDL